MVSQAGDPTAPRWERWQVARAPYAWRPADAVLAVVAAVLVQGELWDSDVEGPFGVLVVGGLLATLPLAWRRGAPVVSSTLVCAGWLLMTAATTGEFSPQLPVLPVAVAVYSAGAWTRSPARATLAGVVTLGLVLAAYLAAPEGHPDDFFPYALWVGAFGTGRLVHRRSRDAARSATRAAVLEEQRHLAEQAAAERERARIARDLHDVIGHSVSLMVVQAGAERLRLGGTGPTAEALLRIEDAGRDSLRDLRAMLGVMGEPDGSADDGSRLGPVPDIAALPSLVDRLREAGQVVTLSIEGPTGDVPGGVQLAVYRVVQEALTNVVRHASGTVADVVVQVRGGRVTLTVANDGGHGFDQRVGGAEGNDLAAAGGRGLVGMRERVAAHAGTLMAGRVPGGGFRVSADIPVTP